MSKYLNNFCFILFLCLLLTNSCDEDIVIVPDDTLVVTDTFTQTEIVSQDVVVNPSGYTPLTAKIDLSTSVATKVKIRVVGKNGSASDVVKMYDVASTSHSIQILGLYINYNNIVELILYDVNDAILGSSAVNILTKANTIEDFLPSIEINTSLADKKPGMTLVSYLAYKIPLFFDEFGDIRWYLDYSTSSELSTINYDVGVERLKNGNLYFGNVSNGTIYEIDMFGEIINKWPHPGYGFHHNVIEKPNGNFIASVDKLGIATEEDHIIEIERGTGNVINVWDLRESLQEGRMTLTNDIVDWIHVNGVEYDESDNTIIVSGRTQGVIKLDNDNNVVWILSPHRDWGLAGDGTDLNTKLLQPLDGNSQAISDTLIVNGYTNHTDFEWCWYQHAIELSPNGNWFLFDNGHKRNYESTNKYSRAVEYKIDPINMTIQQIWQYGKDRGLDAFSFILSDVDHLSSEDHIIFSAGAINNGGISGKHIEVDHTNPSTVFFEATVTPPASYPGIVSFHRTERLSLYP